MPSARGNNLAHHLIALGYKEVVLGAPLLVGKRAHKLYVGFGYHIFAK